jgi:hypothetical protein
VTADVLRAAHGHDGDPLCIEVPPSSRSQRLDRTLVADPLDEYDRLDSSLDHHDRPPSDNTAGPD